VFNVSGKGSVYGAIIVSTIIFILAQDSAMKLFLRNKETHIFIFRLRGQRQAKKFIQGWTKYASKIGKSRLVLIISPPAYAGINYL